MQSYSMDLRTRVLKDCDEGLPTKQVAEKYRVSPAWVRRLKQRRRETGETQPRPNGHRPTTWIAFAEPIRQLVESENDLTLIQIKERLQLMMSLTTLWRVIKTLGLTVKKNDPRRRTEPT